MKGEYVQKIGGTFRVAGTRVSLDSIVYAFQEGQSAESIAENYPALTLEQVYGALAYYLRRQSEINAYLRREEAADERVRRESEVDPADLIRKLRRVRDANQVSGLRQFG